MKNTLIAIKLFIMITLITGVAYPLLITGFAYLVFPQKSSGSLIIKNNAIVGSKLIGQQFTKPEFFWGRPSSISNNPLPSGGSNLNPIGNTLKKQIEIRKDSICKYHGNINLKSIPKDLIFASGSGVDPDISPEAAYFQVDRIVQYRHFSDEQKNKLKKIIEMSIERPDLLIFGEPRINVLELNLKLTEL